MFLRIFFIVCIVWYYVGEKMCGIIGCIGGDCVQNVLQGLHFLEYRGYDSSGIAVSDGKKIRCEKKAGRVSVLESSLTANDYVGSACIGHTRWATHGSPSDQNAHPFLSNDGNFALVHNGVIENYLEWKTFLRQKNYYFSSETDSEVIVCLLQYYYNGDVLQALRQTVQKLKGSFAIAVLTLHEDGKIFIAKRDNPLIVSVEEEKAFVSSDIPAISSVVSSCIIPDDGTIGVVSNSSVRLYGFDGVPKRVYPIALKKKDELSLGSYRHFMRKEIDEIPDALSRAFRSYTHSFHEKILYGISRIVFVGCGTALHAGACARQLLRERLPSLDCYEIAASELIFTDYPYDTTLFVAVSQSGETADTVKAVKKIKKNGGKVLAICNESTSSLVREADEVILTEAGTEIAVASTKAYASQLAVLIEFCFDVIRFFGRGTTIPPEVCCQTAALPEICRAVLACEESVRAFVKECSSVTSVFYLGRGTDYCVAREGSLKLKEISYIHSEAYVAGELKHGTLALMEKCVLVVALITQEKTLDKMLTCLAEVKSRGAKIVVVTKFSSDKIEELSDFTVTIPDVSDVLTPIPSVIPLQLFAYYAALERGCDVDKPRHLAKSVTVE